MTLKVLFAAGDHRWAQYKDVLPAALQTAGLDVDLRPDHVPAQTDYIVYAPNPEFTDFSPFANTKAVLCLWAGVEDIVGNTTLTQPLTRMVDDGLAEGMVEWVTGHVLRHHLGMDAHIVNPDHSWVPDAPPLARDRNITILGLGALGSACAQALAALNFNVTGWSRSPKALSNITCLSGPSGLSESLIAAEIVILLLPLTTATENILNAEKLANLPKGAVIINPGRGPLIDDDALLNALDQGQIAHATLDVFRIEPLPESHRYCGRTPKSPSRHTSQVKPVP